ncbi:MAG: OmpA family protein [candidate division WOR-3 bacterium]|nr:OmpA family protein [candidate division WOR-3 bacterium]
MTTHYRADASRRMLRVCAIIAVLALAAPAAAMFNSPTLLFSTPTSDVLPAHSLAISADMTLPLTQTPQNVPYWEANANVRFSPFRHLDLAVTAYTLQDYVLDAKYQLVGGAPGRFGLAVGVLDVGIHNYVSPIGHGLDDAWPNWKYAHRPMENFSVYAVTSIPVTKFARLHLGLGRGRFVGYGRGKDLNTDIFFDENHQWAVGLFGGLEVFVVRQVALCAEVTGRDVNTGVKGAFGPVTAAVAWTKMEGLIRATGDDRFGRLEAGVSYQVDNLFRSQEKTEIPLHHVQPAPEPEQPPVAAPSPEKLPLGLNPIWFKWNKWDITAEAAATLRQNADVLLAHPDMRIVITGYASEEGTLEHNPPLSTRRAYAAYEYLQSLGVPAAQMRTRALDESAGRPLPMHRSVYFEIER